MNKDITDWNRFALADDEKDMNDCAYWWEAYGSGWMDTKCTSGLDPELNYVCENGKIVNVNNIKI